MQNSPRFFSPSFNVENCKSHSVKQRNILHSTKLPCNTRTNCCHKLHQCRSVSFQKQIDTIYIYILLFVSVFSCIDKFLFGFRWALRCAIFNLLSHKYMRIQLLFCGILCSAAFCTTQTQRFKFLRVHGDWRICI